MPKRSIREAMLARRRHCSAETCLGLSLEIQSRFLCSDYFRRAACLALYSAIGNEVLTEDIARQAIASGKRLVYPRVAEARLEFIEVPHLGMLSPAGFGVMEPVAGPEVPLGDIDTLVVPGVAFDKTGHRLGYGKGYYDRTLTDCAAEVCCVGLAYDFQVVEQLPVQVHDRPVTALLTESRTLVFTVEGQRG